eukprot:CAMPEP_0180686640 /NCGR_PEP_ID=MMETSP1037_2-20121125/73030_1 /TAXON_ID=632150 /ORGANISM="Azadinium spinosum, Strain 3D9" /LENGTH=69 /DNA_ID=CAMNT_0022717377 /DNA_START=86 /DNA_END=295 /DNA_ORIENTATION=+
MKPSDKRLSAKVMSGRAQESAPASQWPTHVPLQFTSGHFTHAPPVKHFHSAPPACPANILVTVPAMRQA